MNRHSTNPWARLRVLLMLPAVAFAAVVASACKQDTNSTEDFNTVPQNEKITEWDVIEVEEAADTTEAFMVIENMPQFPGGDEAMFEFFRNNVTYPENCIADSIQGRVIATFIVEKDGSITDIEVVRSVHPDLDAEAVRVINAMPAWNPGTQRGKPVRVMYTIPVLFKL